jgi:hypothetical protein
MDAVLILELSTYTSGALQQAFGWDVDDKLPHSSAAVDNQIPVGHDKRARNSGNDNTAIFAKELKAENYDIVRIMAQAVQKTDDLTKDPVAGWALEHILYQFAKRQFVDRWEAGCAAVET